MELRERLQAALAGRYTVDHEIGRGGMAIVFHARDLRHDREVALKVLRPELAATIGTERFLQEIKLAAGLAHPHILPLYDSGDADGCLYYAMPFVRGESLRDLLVRQQRLPITTALQIVGEVADALAYAHEAGIAHRDVKPENILLQAGHAVVSDFGIARAINAAGIEHMTVPGTVVGTREYMSPEQAYGSPSLDGRADIYGLGCVLYEMLVGQPPSGGTTPGGHLTALPRAIRSGLARVKPPLPPSVTEAIVRTLAEAPEDRFRNALEFSGALSAADGKRASPTRWIATWIPRVLVLLVSVFAGRWALVRWIGQNSTGRAVASSFDPTHIAVMYFDVHGDSVRLEPVAAGLTEDLIDALNRVPTLAVVSTTGVRPLRGRSPPTDSVARVFDVGTIVSGTVERVADSLRVVVRLVDAASGRQLHSQEFVRPVRDLFTLENQLTEDIAEFLRQRLGEAVAVQRGRAATSSVEAWELVQRSIELQEYARQLSATDGGASRRAFVQADSVAARAVALDPSWPEPLLRRGWIAWSRAVVSASATGQESESVSRLKNGLEYADRALALAPGDARALQLRGSLRYQEWALSSTDTQYRALAENDLRAAVRSDPDLARAWYTLSDLLSSKGELTEAEAAARKAFEKDAYLQEAQEIVSRLFVATLQRGEFTEAGRWCAEGQQRYPEDLNLLECRLTLLGWSGRGARDVVSAWSEFARLDTVTTIAVGRPYRYLLVADVLARTGWKDSALALVRATRQRYPHDELDLQEASVRLLLGDREATLRLLSALLHLHPGYRGYVANHYWFRTLQSDPRFTALTAGAE